MTVDDYYGWIFDRSVPGLPEAAAAEGLSPLAYMRRYGAFRVKADDYRYYEKPVTGDEKGVSVDGTRVAGFDTPSRKLEFWSPTMGEFGWPEHALPGYIRSQVHWSELDRAAGEAVLLPTFRLPTLIHTRSANAKWLVEISHRNPLWVHPVDARRIGIGNDDLVRVNTAIGWFVVRAWVTDGLRPGIVACSHHMGRWRLGEGAGVGGWTAAPVSLEEERAEGGSLWRIRHEREVIPFASDDPDSSRIWWSDAGVHQNLAFPVQPDPVSGMHCWHQKVRLEPAREGDRYGDVVVDTAKSHAIYREWLARTRPAKPGGLRRPLWFSRPVRPADSAYRA
jgi:anaerobic selenocysteine-containing dehydrogenase